jgi:hypothetical protein
MTLVSPELAASYGLTVNEYHGLFERGHPYPVAKKLEVAEVYKQHAEEASMGERKLNKNSIAIECRVSPKFVNKIKDEILIYGNLNPTDLRIKQRRAIGPGAKTIDSYASFILLQLYFSCPSRFSVPPILCG